MSRSSLGGTDGVRDKGGMHGYRPDEGVYTVVQDTAALECEWARGEAN